MSMPSGPGVTAAIGKAEEVATAQKVLLRVKVYDPPSALEEDDQYTYLEELAPRMTKMHLQFLMGIIGFDDDEEEDFGEEVRACHG